VSIDHYYLLFPAIERFLHRTILGPIVNVADIIYWMNVRTTVGVSIFASGLSSIALLLQGTIEYLIVDFGSLFFLPLFLLFDVAPALLKVRALARIEHGWQNRSSWIPTVRRTPPTRRERASERLDQAVPRHWKVIVRLIHDYFTRQVLIIFIPVLLLLARLPLDL
jgi:hypothetical protein